MAGHQGTSTRKDPHEALAAMIEAERRDMHTSLPGQVVDYDAKTQTATVKPLLKQTFAGQELQAPDLVKVPVAHPRAGGFILHKPLKKGDQVVLHIPSRSIEDWDTEGKSVDGAPKRMHDLSDAIAYPGGYPSSKPAKVPEKGVYFGKEDGKNGITISEDGRLDFKIEGDSVFKAIADLIGELTSMKTVVSSGSSTGLWSHDKIAALTAIKGRVEKLMV
ncbi:Gp138 family membrane-puncturing spike protein [Alsobacter sp. KACC 23698]|uniref:Gp138 family membrane-puncturing spike protein n=1 Tax=Alsobacter sp. KACC 23698 TaxID=3149229 RepID=A0AAU7JN84_9HYPH